MEDTILELYRMELNLIGLNQGDEEFGFGEMFYLFSLSEHCFMNPYKWFLFYFYGKIYTMHFTIYSMICSCFRGEILITKTELRTKIVWRTKINKSLEEYSAQIFTLRHKIFFATVADLWFIVLSCY